MTEFTPEWIAKARNACIFFGEPATTEFRKALDEIERLQKENKELKEFVDATRPTGICEICTSTVIKENARLRGEKERLSVTMKLIKDRGLKHGVEWCVATASGALESEGE